MSFLCGFSCLSASAISAPQVNMELCNRIPDFFFPQSRPQNYADPLVKEAQCQDRIAQFASAMGYSVEVLSESMPSILELNRGFENFLIENRDRLFRALQIYGLLPDSVSEPPEASSRDSRIFKVFFELLGSTALTRNLFGIFLRERNPLREVENVILILQSRFFRYLSQIPLRICRIISARVPRTGNTLESGYYGPACSGGAYSLAKIIKNLETSELAYLLEHLEAGPETTRFIQNKDLHVFIQARHDRQVAADSLVDSVRRVPMEIDPFSKYMCIRFSIPFFCGRLLRRAERLRRIDDLSAKVAMFRSHTFGMDFSALGSFRVFLGFELETRDPNFDMYSEFTSAKIDAHRIFSLAILTEKYWPLLERVVSANTASNQFKELALVQSGIVTDFLDEVAQYRATFPLRANKIRRLAAFPLEKLATLLDCNPETELEILSEIVDAFKNFDPRKEKRKLRKQQLINERIKSPTDVSQKGCDLCFRKFGWKPWLRPVKICDGQNNCEGHFACLSCTHSWLVTTDKNECPFCRSKFLVDRRSYCCCVSDTKI